MHLNVWRHHWALWGRQKHPFWGSKIIVSSWSFVHWLRTASSTTYIPVFEIFEHFGFCDHFSKKKIFLEIFGIKKAKLKKSEIAILQTFLSYVLSIFRLHLTQKLYFWWIFKHLPLIGPKSREVTSQNSTYSKKIPSDFDFLCTRRRQIDARRGVPSFMSIQ